MRRAHQLLELGIFGLQLRDDVADRLVDQRQPDFLGTHELRIGQRSERRARHAICAATTTRNVANSFRNVGPESVSATAAPPCAAAAAATPITRAPRQRTLP